MHKSHIFTLILISFSLAHAGWFSKKYKATNTLGIKFSKNVPQDQSILIDQDLTVLKTVFVDDPQQEIARLFNITPSATNLETWLSQRVHYIVPEDYEIDQNTIKILKNNYNYPNTILPDIEKATATTDTDAPKKNTVVVMSNIGSYTYYIGKKTGDLLGLDVPGIGVIPANSPRMGLIKIGAGHFFPLLKKSGSVDNHSLANSLVRLGTFFHEARHSDGNGKSLSFPHAICPEGHNLAGFSGCDRNLNGPYTIEAVFVKSILNNCNKCSEPEKEAMRNEYMDSYTRVLVETPRQPTDSSIPSSLKKTCEDLKKIDPKYAPSFCNKTEEENPPSNTPSTNWDDTPEVGSL